MGVRGRIPHSFILGIVVVLAACGGSSEPGSGEQGAAGQAPASAEVVQHMHQHLDQVREVQHALVRGDLEDARKAAQRFAEHQELTGLPERASSAVQDMKKQARSLAAAGSLDGAGDATGRMLADCGACHRAMSANPNVPSPAPTEVKAKNETAARMLEHERAVNMLYRGLVGPSDDLWKEGAQALRDSPLKADTFPADAELSREALDAQSRTHEVAEKALDAGSQDQRAEIYGDLLAGCASCHSLSGRVLGPGLPK